MAALPTNMRKFVSYEPALEPVSWKADGWEFIDWLICGGESGPKSGENPARPFRLEWARQARDFARDHNIPFWFKQFGTCHNGDQHGLNITDKKGADSSEWPDEIRIQETPFQPRQIV